MELRRSHPKVNFVIRGSYDFYDFIFCIKGIEKSMWNIVEENNFIKGALYATDTKRNPLGI
jgi:hypothetical protein